ncbi:unnamed protein product [Enterobius vermicularis]|uniref:Uncharacterized protein n=1 Tax=Enterobius vermicularis TaxID=51028 RepID=A0A0N4VDU7_ENTVE|nr:unnamed protein product [Enterobius vermicularis]
MVASAIAVQQYHQLVRPVHMSLKSTTNWLQNLPDGI